MKVLVFDTALEACSAAVLDAGRVAAARSEAMARGHQERLAPLVAELLAEAGLEPAALDRIGVTVGPGSFTGLRVGLAFAKGLGLALDRPVVGVGTLEALAASAARPALPSGTAGEMIAAAIDARRGQVYVQAFRSGASLTLPEALSVEDAAAKLRALGEPSLLVGSGARLLGEAFPGAELDARAGADAATLARLVAGAEPSGALRPVYLRAPDAKLPGGLEPPAC